MTDKIGPTGLNPIRPSEMSGLEMPVWKDEFAAEEVSQKRDSALFESRYVDKLVGSKDPVKSALGSTVQKHKNLNQNPFRDVIVPFSQRFDPEKYTVLKSVAALGQALEKQSIPIPDEFKPMLAKSSVSSVSKPVLSAPKMSTEEAQKEAGIFHRFVAWISDLFGKSDKAGEADIQDLDGKLVSPAQRNHEAIRDCLKKLNESLEKMRELVQTDSLASSSIDAESATMFLLLISAIKRHDDYKKKEIVQSEKEMMDGQKAFKEAHKKYLEALNGTLFLPKLSKWVLTPLECASTAVAVASFGVAGAAVVVGVATGGVGAVVGAVASVSLYFVAMQSIAFIGKGAVKIVQATAKHTQDKHKGEMIRARFEQDEMSLRIQEEMKSITDNTTEISKAWESLSDVLEQKSTTISMMKN